MNDKESGSLKLLRFKYRRGDQIIHPLCRIRSPPEIRSPHFNLEKLQQSDNGTPESCRMHWNLMKDEEFGSLKLLEF